MAQLIQIDDTLRRSVSPQAGVSPNREASGEAFGAGVGRALMGLGAEMRQAADFFAAEQRQRQNFENEAGFIKNQGDNATLLEQKAREAEGTSAKDFTKSYMADVRKRNAEFLANIPEADRPKWKARIASAEAQLAQNALKTEFQTYDGFQTAQLGNAQEGYLKGIDQTPAAVQDYVKAGEDFIDQTNWPAGVREEKKQAWRESAAKAYALARIRQDPRAAAADLGAPEYRTGPRNQPQAYAMQKFMAAGFTKEQAAGIVGNMIQESGAGLRTDALNPGDGTDGSDSIGILQWNSTRAKQLKAYAASKGKDWRDFDTQLEFVVIELNTTEKAAGDAIRASKTAEEAASAAVTGYIRPQGSDKGANSAHGWQNRLNSALRLSGVDVGDVPVDPNLANLSYKDMLLLRDAAANEDQRRTAEISAAQTAAYNTQLNDLKLGVYEGRYGADAIAAAKQTWLNDYGDVAAVDGILKAREKETADYNLFAAKIAANGATWNPFDKTDTDAIEAGVKQLGGTPQAAFNVWQKTGVLADTGAVALRGALLATDPQKVLSAATIAGNMIATNPNAFAGVTGQADLEKAGVAFNHLVNDRGLTPDEAARRIAQENDPEYRAKIKVTDDAVAQFQKDLFKSDNTAAILDAFDPGYLSSEPAAPAIPAQKQALLLDYAEAAADAFRLTGDADAAQAKGLAEVKKNWGVSRGALTKFPPEKAYPASGDPEDPHGYVYRQAAGDIYAATGKVVEPDDVFLVPLPGGRTAEPYRSGKLPPYQVFYRATDPDTGQPMFDTIYGNGFVPDVARAQSEAKVNREALFRQKQAEDTYRAWQDQKAQRDLVQQQQQMMLDQDRQNQLLATGEYDPEKAPKMAIMPELPPEPPAPPTLANPPSAINDTTGQFSDPMTGFMP